MDTTVLDTYIDYITASFGKTTATGMSELLDGEISHDRITRMLSENNFTSSDLWKFSKNFVRKNEDPDGILVIDDSISKKPYMDENDIICFHYDHCTGNHVKGINFITALYSTENISVPVAFNIVEKTEAYTEKKTGKKKRRSPVAKNEYFKDLVLASHNNNIQFRYVAADSWFSSSANMKFIKNELGKDFVIPIKKNRKIAFVNEEGVKGKFVRADEAVFRTDRPTEIYLKGVDFPVLISKQVFKNKDGSTGVMYLVSSDAELTRDGILKIYQRRWNVECFHKSLKQNASLEKSPARSVRAQRNHFFASMCGYIRLEMMKMSSRLNHYAIKSIMYMNALKASFLKMKQLQDVAFSA
jgi:hypothetical protein